MSGVVENRSDRGDARSGSVLRSTARGAGWILAWRGIKRLLGLINTLILARLLLPADFGLVALGAALAGALGSLTAIGVEEALIREARADAVMYDTGFTLNFLRAAVMALALALIALPAADFYHDPRLANVIYALSFCTFVTGLTNIGTVDFMRRLDFSRDFVLLSIPRLISFVVTILVAAATRSYYSLVFGMVANRVSAVIMSYTMHRYRPRISVKGWRSIARFSAWTWVNGIMLTVRDQSTTFLVGHALGESSVGVYSVGIDLATMPTNEILSPFIRAGFPAFAAVRRDEGDVSGAFLRMLGLATFMTVPAAIGVSAISDPLERLLLGPKWLTAIPIIQVFGVLLILTAAGAVSEVMLSAHGRLARLFPIYALSAAARLLSLMALVPAFGLIGAVWAIGAVGALECLIWLATAARTLKVSFRRILPRVARPLVAAGFMAAILYGIGLGWHTIQGSPLYLIISVSASVLVGAVCYFSVDFGIWAMIGRPLGAETDFLQVVDDIYGRWLQWQRLRFRFGEEE